MIGHILLALALAYLALAALIHLSIIGLCAIWRLRGNTLEQVQATPAFSLLVFAGTIVLYPVFIPISLYIRARRFLAAYRLACLLLRSVDVSALPEDEQKSFVERMRDAEGEERRQLIRETIARVREAQEAAK